jgi:DTW domain-containing protein YfiP
MTAQQPLQLVLLTHPTELDKKSNTGAVVMSALQAFPQHQVEVVLWSRVAPDPRFLNSDEFALIYPQAQAMALDCDDPAPVILPRHIHRLILLDATWQLAQKMYNQSPYLQEMPALKLQSSKPSTYLLRRNQRQAGWCTAECVAMILEKSAAMAAAQAVRQGFAAFNLR